MVKLNTLSRKLTTIGYVKLSITVFFPPDKIIVGNKYYKDSNSSNILLDFPCFIKFELPYRAESTKRRWINLTYMGKIQMISAMESMLNIINTKEVFVNDSELGLVVTTELDKNGRSKWSVYEQIGESGIVIYPTVIHEENTSVSYKGIGIAINEATNNVEMSIAEFIGLYRFLKEIDIWSLSQAMFNTSLMLTGIRSLSREMKPVEKIIDNHEDSIQPRRRLNIEQWKSDRAEKLETEAKKGQASESDGS